MTNVNKTLLRAVADHNGHIAAEIIAPFLGQYHDSSLRWQLNQPEAAGQVLLDKSIKGRVICSITETGMAALREE